MIRKRRFKATFVAHALVFIVGVAGGLFSGSGVASAETQQTLMPRLAGREYVRSEFDGNNALTGRQEIQIGPLEGEGNRRGFTARVSVYDRGGSLHQQTAVRVVCNLRDPVMLMGFVDLLAARGGGQLDIEVDPADPLLMVPADPVDSLADLRITVRSKGGWRGVIGGRKVLAVSDRRVEHLTGSGGGESLEVQLRVRERVAVYSYGLGVRLRSQFYRGMAEFDAGGGLFRYELRGSDGTRVAIARRSESDPTGSHDEPHGQERKGALSR